MIFPIYQSFLPAQGNIQAPPIVVSNENYVVCSVTSTGASSYTSRMYGFNGDGTELWDRGLFAGVFAPMLVDPLGNIYLSALTEGADAGVYCVNDGHNIVWHYSTPGMVPGAPCPAYTNLLVLHVRADSPDAATTTLAAIGVVEPEGSV
ncbi:hypothetical protein IT575_11185 [bacterium]|nr:hypothetical protein [bacterium]